jgi:hypothetical protein
MRAWRIWNRSGKYREEGRSLDVSGCVDGAKRDQPPEKSGSIRTSESE